MSLESPKEPKLTTPREPSLISDWLRRKLAEETTNGDAEEPS